MQPHEFCQYEFSKPKQILDGRWAWRKYCDVESLKINETDEDPTPEEQRGFAWIFKKCKERAALGLGDPKFITSFYWDDLFGQHKSREFSITTPFEVHRIVPLSQHFSLIFSVDEDDYKFFCQIAKLDWSTNEAELGPSFEVPNIFHETVIDQQQSNLDVIDFLYSHSSNFWQYQVHLKEKRLEKIGNVIRLERDDFTCIYLNGGIVLALNLEVGRINRYNVKERKGMDPIMLSGELPEKKLVNGGENLTDMVYGDWKSYEMAVFANSNHLFLRTLEGVEHEESAQSRIYHIDVTTGKVTLIDFVFNGWIRRMQYIEKEECLYVCTQKYLNNRGFFGTEEVEYGNSASNYINTHFRVKVGRPETLRFLTTFACPKSMSEKVKSMSQKNEDIPLILNKFNKIESKNE